MPELIVLVHGVIFPSEPDFLKNCLSIKPKFVIIVIGPLITNPVS
jgi:hypothetical protein